MAAGQTRPTMPPTTAAKAAKAFVRGSASVARAIRPSVVPSLPQGAAAGQAGGQGDHRAQDDEDLAGDVEDVHGAPEHGPQGGALARVLADVGGHVQQRGEHGEDHDADRDEAGADHLERPPPVSRPAGRGGEAGRGGQRRGEDQPAGEVGAAHEQLGPPALGDAHGHASSACPGCASAMLGLTTDRASLTSCPASSTLHQQPAARWPCTTAACISRTPAWNRPLNGLAGHHLGHDLAQERAHAHRGLRGGHLVLEDVDDLVGDGLGDGRLLEGVGGDVGEALRVGEGPPAPERDRGEQGEERAGDRGARCRCGPGRRAGCAGVAPPVAGGTPADPYVTREPYSRWRSGVSDVALDGRSGSGEHDACSSVGARCSLCAVREHRPGMAKWPLSITKP